MELRIIFQRVMETVHLVFKRPIVVRAVASVKAALETEAVQLKLGGYAGPYEKAKRKGKAK